MGACGSTSSAHGAAEKKEKIIVPPDMALLPLEQRAQAAKQLVLQISKQQIEFAFRKTDILPSGQQVLKDVASALAALPEVSLCVEGHSNYIAKVANKQTPQDKKRMVQLSQDRAEAVKKVLQAQGVQNEINCVGLGCQKREAVGCVKLVVVAATGTSNPVEIGSPVKHASKQDWAKEPDDTNKSEYLSGTAKADANDDAIFTKMDADSLLMAQLAAAKQVKVAATHDVVVQLDGDTQASTENPPESRVISIMHERLISNDQFVSCRSVPDEWDDKARTAVKEDNPQQDRNAAASAELSGPHGQSKLPAEPTSPAPLRPPTPSSFVDATKLQDDPQDDDPQDADPLGKPMFIQDFGGPPDIDSSSRNPLGMFCCSDKPKIKGCPAFRCD